MVGITDLFFFDPATSVFTPGYCIVEITGGVQHFIQKLKSANINADLRFQAFMGLCILLFDLIEFIVIGPDRRADGKMPVKQLVFFEELSYHL